MSKAKGWFSQVCELEREGRFDEARALLEANTTAEQRASIAENFGKAFRGISPEAIAEAEEIMKRFRALDELPADDEKRIVWERFWDSTPAFMAPFWRRLKDPLKRRGAPRGSRVFSEAMFDEMDRRTREGQEPTPAARAIIGEVAYAQDKSRADYLVKQWRKRGKKSD